MANLKSLAKDTAIYGLSSIVGRFLNYLLVPLYTANLSAASGGYGIITNMYAYSALLLVILTYGMETTFFRFSNKEGCAEGIFHHTDGYRLNIVAFCRIGIAVPFANIVVYGLCRPSVVCMGDGCNRSARCLPVHTLRISAL